MLKTAISAAALAAAMGTASTGLAGSWGVGVGFGFETYPHYGPPPGYYEAPRLYGQVRPRDYYGGPLVILGPAPPPYVGRMVTADDVFDMLEAAGYREFGPMAHRGAHYMLRAVNRRGDLVALEVSAYTGAIDREVILAQGSLNVPAAAAAPASPRTPRSRPQVTPPQPAAGERDPLVVY
jgi:hypothetical protein